MRHPDELFDTFTAEGHLETGVVIHRHEEPNRMHEDGVTCWCRPDVVVRFRGRQIGIRVTSVN